MADFPASLADIVSNPKIITPQLTLRKLLSSDAAALFALVDDNRLYLGEWLNWVDKVREVQDSLNFIKQVNAEIEQNKFLTFGIFFAGNLAGIISFNKIDWQNKHANIGYWLAENYQGKGIITMACQALINFGFTELDLVRLNINFAVENYQSQAVPQRLSFTKGELLKDYEFLNGKKVDHITYFRERNC